MGLSFKQQAVVYSYVSLIVLFFFLSRVDPMYLNHHTAKLARWSSHACRTRGHLDSESRVSILSLQTTTKSSSQSVSGQFIVQGNLRWDETNRSRCVTLTDIHVLPKDQSPFVTPKDMSTLRPGPQKQLANQFSDCSVPFTIHGPFMTTSP